MTFGLDRDYTDRVDRRRVIRVVSRFAVFVVALNVVVAIGGALLAPSVEGPAGSSFVTEEDGIAAWRELLDDLGQSPDQLREPLNTTSVSAAATALIAIQPDVSLMDRAYVDAVERFVAAGGQLVTTAGNELSRTLVPDASLQNGTSGEASPPLPIADVRGVSTVVFDGGVFFDDTGKGVALVSDREGRALALVAVVGDGRVVLLAEKSAVTNRLLATADNAAFAVGIASDRAIIFDEYVHGYGIEEGVRGLPWPLRRTVAVLLLGAVIWMWAAGRRLGAPEQPARSLPPARSEFVSALGATLAKSGHDEAGYGALRRHGLDLLIRISGDDPASQAAQGIARSSGVTDTELRALLRPIMSKEDVLAIGRAVTKLQTYAVGKDV